MKKLFFALILVLTLILNININAKNQLPSNNLIYSDSITYCAGPASKCWCYRLIYNSNMIPASELTTDPIDNCFWENGYTIAPIIDGVQYTLGLFATFQDMQNFLNANNLYLDTNSNYYPVLDTSH